MKLKEGEYYYSKYPTNYEYIFVAGKQNTNESTCIEIRKKELHIKNSSFTQENTIKQLFDLRKATDLEKQWLQNCIKANRYVECPTIEENVLNNLQIW